MRNDNLRPMGGGIWWIFLLRGVLAAALGVFALVWPTLTLSILVLIVGLYLIADGVMGLVLVTRRGTTASRFLQPVASAVIGLLLVLWPDESVRTLFVILGVAALFVGVSYVMTARRVGLDEVDRRLTTVAGAVVALLGLVLIVWPGAAVVTLSWIIAAAALLAAVVLVFLGVRFRQMQARANDTAA